MANTPVDLYGLMAELATCLCAQIAVDGTSVCYCGLMPGEQVAIDYVSGCDDKTCGMAWVRLMDAAPASGLGVPDFRPGNCGSGLGATVEVGIVRCAPMSDDEGNPAPAAEQIAATVQQMADMMTMRRAILCCASSKDWRLGTYSPLGPAGGALGGRWSIEMMVV